MRATLVDLDGGTLVIGMPIGDPGTVRRLGGGSQRGSQGRGLPLGLPAPRPGSVRRTVVIDHHRAGDVITMSGRFRDLRTSSNTCAVVATAALDATVEYQPQPVLTSVRLDGPSADLSTLVGRGVGSGFRAAAARLVSPGTGEYALLDDIPVCTIVSRYSRMLAVAQGRPRIAIAAVATEGKLAHGVDMCAGFGSGGTVATALQADHFVVPDAETVLGVPTADPLPGWELAGAELRPGGMRRWRCTDVWPDGDRFMVSSVFRDTHHGDDGSVQVIHEYAVEAVADAVDADFRLLECTAVPGALPFAECLGAVASPQSLVGTPVAELRETGRSLSGTSACTHLTDQLRGLADVPYLVASATRTVTR